MENFASKKASPDLVALLRRNNLLAEVVKAELVESLVSDIPIKPEETSEALKNYCLRNNIKSDEELIRHLNEKNLSKSDLEWSYEKPVKMNIYAKKYFSNKAEAHFLKRKDELDKVVYSLIRVNNPFLARELYLRISGGETSFSEIAENFSEGPEKSSKGVIGPISLTQAHPKLSERLRTTSPGKLMEPFQIDQWWLIARVERLQSTQFNEEIRQKMCNELFQAWLKEGAGV